MSAGGFQQVPGTDSGSYNLMDPEGYTRQAAGNLFGDMAQNMVNKGQGAMNAWTTQGPGSFTNMFMNDFSQLGKAITDETSPYAKQLQSQQQQNIQQGLSQAGQSLSNMGALRSSGMGEAAGDVVGRAATDASTKLAEMQTGLLGQYGNQLMGQRANAYNQMMGMPGQILGYQTQFASPNYVAPQYIQQPGFMDQLLGGIGALGGLAGNVGQLAGGFNWGGGGGTT